MTNSIKYPEKLQAELQKREDINFSDDNLSKWAKQIIDIAENITKLQTKRMNKAYFKKEETTLLYKIHKTTKAEAFCWKEKEIAFIGISYGLIYNAACLISYAMCNRLIFPDVGNASLEEEPSPILTYMPSSLLDSDFQPQEPKCKIRKFFIVILLERIISNIFFHEAGHLIHGHLDFIKENSLTETSTVLADPNLVFTRHALEFHADNRALEETFNYCLFFKESYSLGQDTPTKRLLDSEYESDEKIIRLNFIAAYFMLRAYEYTNWDFEEQKKTTHPAPNIRMVQLLISSESILTDFLKKNDYQSRDLIEEWCIEAELYYAKIKNEELNLEGIKSVLESKKIMEYINKVKNILIEIIPKMREITCH